MATNVGMYELVYQTDAVPIQVTVDPLNPGRPLYSVAALTDVRGQVSIAVATQESEGVYSFDAGRRAGHIYEYRFAGRRRPRPCRTVCGASDLLVGGSLHRRR